MTATVVITLGRNIGAIPMPIETWNSFKRDVLDTLDVMGFTIIQRPAITHAGAGFSVDQWGMWEGHTEPACTFVALADKGMFAVHSADYLRQCLGAALRPLLATYKQDAIGLVVAEGCNHLVLAE